MPKRSDKPRDRNSLAAAIAGQATDPRIRATTPTSARISPLSSWGGSGASPGCLTE